MTRHADEVTFCLTLTTPLEMSFGGSSSGASYNTLIFFFIHSTGRPDEINFLPETKFGNGGGLCCKVP